MKPTVAPALAAQLRRLTARQKAALADHLWREAELGIEPDKRSKWERHVGILDLKGRRTDDIMREIRDR